MRTTIASNLFLEQIALGAEIQPLNDAFNLRLQVGRRQYTINLEDLNARQQHELERLYRARQIRFGHPGDFVIAPFFFRGPLHTRIHRLS